jgi:hypothetical protein
LAALGAPEPDDLPPYDESRYEPVPEVEIDPKESSTRGCEDVAFGSVC